MIFNENGTVVNVNTEYNLLEFLNSRTPLDDLLEENICEASIGDTLKAVWNKLVEKIGAAIDWIKKIVNRGIIKANQKKISENLAKCYNDDGVAKLKGEIAKYVGSYGFANGRWIESFDKAIDMICEPKTSIDDVKNALYCNHADRAESWFEVGGDVAIKTNIKPDDIIGYALSVSDYLKPLQQSYNKLKKMDKTLDGIHGDIMSAVSTYFTKAMISIKNLSTASIKVCLHALKNNTKEDFTKA